MIVALLWLTISTPFVFRVQQEVKKIQKEIAADLTSGSSEDNNPFANTTEEKAPPTNTISEEYLHHLHNDEHPWFSIIKVHWKHSSSLYIAYHGELFCPPPNT